jgi:hypothetical protein
VAEKRRRRRRMNPLLLPINTFDCERTEDLRIQEMLLDEWDNIELSLAKLERLRTLYG